MKKLYLSLAALGLLGLAACSDDDPVAQPSVPAEMTFTASLEAVPDGPALSWSAFDAISLFDGKANNDFTTADGGSDAQFVGIANSQAEAYRAVSPAIPGVERYNGRVAVSIPASAVGVSGGVAGKTWAAAYVANNGNKTLQFKNLCAFLKIQLKAVDRVVSVSVQANRNEPIAGAMQLGLFEEPTIEPAANGAVPAVTMTGTALDGTFYIAVCPQTLAGGYTLTLVNDEELRFTQVVPAEVTFEQNAVYDLGNFANVAWEAAVNPNPTQLPSVSLIRASFMDAPFNVLSNGDFEDWPNEPFGYRSAWWDRFPDVAMPYLGPGYNSSSALRIDNEIPGVWARAAMTVAIRPNTTYDFTCVAKAGGSNGSNCYITVNPFTVGPLQEIPGWSWAPQENWTPLATTIQSYGNFYADVYVGMWGDPGNYVTVDDLYLVPVGYDKRSMKTESAAAIAPVVNNSFDAVTSLGKAVAWRGTDGKIMIALSDLTVNGAHYDTAIAVTEEEDIASGLSISRFLKASGSLTPIGAANPGETIVPNDVFVIGNKTYMHYHARTYTNGDDWGASGAGFLVSEDNGRTWTRAPKMWRGKDQDGRFVAAAFAQKDGYLYMAGEPAGREPNTNWANMFMARVALTADITDPEAWEYWTDAEWVAGDETAVMIPACCLMTGARGEMALVYNERFDRFQLIYRDARLGGLAYRDADGVDGFWSGEKPLVGDEVMGGLGYAPSVIDVTADGELLLFVPQITY